MSNKWTNREVNILREYYGQETAREISDRLSDRTRYAVLNKAKRLQLGENSSKQKTCELCGCKYEYGKGGTLNSFCSSCEIRRKRIAYNKAILKIKGVECSICHKTPSCSSVLSAHHIGEKSFELTRSYSKSYSQIAQEIQNIQILCKNCHYTEHCEGSRGYCPEHNWDKRCCNKENSCNRSCYVMHLRHERRLSFIEQKGGECEECGYSGCTGALSFHHRDPEDKEFRLDVTAFSRSLDSIEKEVDKCDLLCHNCHKKHHCECEVKCSDIFEDYAEHAEEQIKECL